MRKRHLYSFAALLLMTGCMTFEPYDYDTSEDAKLKKGNYSVKLHGKQLRLEKKIPLPRSSK